MRDVSIERRLTVSVMRAADHKRSRPRAVTLPLRTAALRSKQLFGQKPARMPVGCHRRHADQARP
jgi:hypothetical protein